MRRKLFKSKLALIFALGIVLTVVPETSLSASNRNTALDFERAILASNWNDSMYYYFNTPLSETLPILKRHSESNLVMAQWFYANSLSQQQNYTEASKYLYRASLGTQLDGNSCNSKETLGVEARFVTVFENSFNPIRTNEKVRTEAIKEAIFYYSDTSNTSKNENWVCIMLSHEKKIVLPRQYNPNSQRITQRKKTLEKYKEKTGMDFSRSPDYYKIRTAH